MRFALAILVPIAVVAFATACGDSGDATPTDTPAVTSTVQATEAPPTATSETTTATPPAAVEGPCPIDDSDFCNFAEALDRAIQLGQLETIVSNARLQSETCTGNEGLGPCGGLEPGTELSGYLVGIDASDGIFYQDGPSYLQLLEQLAGTDPVAEDGFGPADWRVVAVVNESPDAKVLVTTSFDNDPIAQDPNFDRRVFLFRLERAGGEWEIAILLTSVFRDQYLIGINPDGSPYPDWFAWGEE